MEVPSEILIFTNPDNPPGERAVAILWRLSMTDGKRKSLMSVQVADTPEEAAAWIVEPHTVKDKVIPSAYLTEMAARGKVDRRVKDPMKKLEQALDRLAAHLGEEL